MKCPECVKKGLKSQINLISVPVYCMAHSPYYDEEGHFHSHNPNGQGFLYRCSNGHEWGPGPVPCPTCGTGWKEYERKKQEEYQKKRRDYISSKGFDSKDLQICFSTIPNVDGVSYHIIHRPTGIEVGEDDQLLKTLEEALVALKDKIAIKE